MFWKQPLQHEAQSFEAPDMGRGWQFKNPKVLVKVP